MTGANRKGVRMKKVFVEEGGVIAVREVPEPELPPRHYATDTQYSLISAGTESQP